MLFKSKIYSALLIFFSSLIFIKHVFPFIRSNFNTQEPQIILVLGGDIDREISGIKIAKELNIPLIISGGSNAEFSDWLIKEGGISKEMVKRDYRAKDTLSNFTSIIDDLKSESINHIILITSKYHINRAKIVGEIISSSRGIRVTSLSIPCNASCEIKAKKESIKKKHIDLIRSVIWVITGQDIKSFIPNFIKYHFKE